MRAPALVPEAVRKLGYSICRTFVLVAAGLRGFAAALGAASVFLGDFAIQKTS
jgi:hypothetical protein